MYSILLMLFMVLASIKTVRNNKPMSVSVIIPAFNEEKTVAHVVSVVKSLPYIGEVVVVDDGSMDQTSKFAEKAGAKVIYHMKNRGKGAAIKTGFKNSNGDIVVFLDADLKNLTQSQVRNIVDPILNGEADVTKTKFKREAGRVTELTAKPLLKFFFPEIKFDQPLSGQFAAKRSFLNKIKLEDDYGVDVGIVLDADVMGMKVKEVDIGNIEHIMSTLTELNVVATEVVRTIVDRATAYGRITMIDSLGHYIRMEILGLSLASLGIFSIFFIGFSPYVGLSISVVGVVIALYYIVKILNTSHNIFSRSDGSMRNLKTFFKMHSPIIVSALILLAMITTLLGSVHIDNGKISIQPVSSNLIIFNSPNSNQTVDVRGPYTIDDALENENTSIRMPAQALATLELNYGDSIYINNEQYVLNVTRPGEDNTMRLPSAVRASIGLNSGDKISDGDLRNRFNNLYAEKALQTNGNSDNINITEGMILSNSRQNGYNINLYLNNSLISSSYGIIKNGTYSIYINGVKYKTITLTPDSLNQSYYIYIGDDTFKVEFGTPVMTDMEFANSTSGKFLNFIY